MAPIYFATNRRPDHPTKPSDFGGVFSLDGLANLRYGQVRLQGKTMHIELAPEKLVVDRDRGCLNNEESSLGSIGVMRSLREKMHKQQRDLVVLVHGYNTSFYEAVKAASKLQTELNRGSANCFVALFTWPSDGSMMPFLAYSNDRHDAAASAPAFARAFMKLSEFLNEAGAHEECDHTVHLVAHSMGNYLLRHALQHIRRENPGRLPRVFDQILMMAADEDDDAFEHDYKLRMLPNIARRVNVYFNRGDLALNISDKTKGNPDRLGTDGPSVPGQLPARVTQIDCSDVVGGKIEHSYYLSDVEVLRDMRKVLKGEASDRISFRTYVPETKQYRLRKG